MPVESPLPARIATFIQGVAGRLFVTYHPPVATCDRGTDLVYIPPFGEEAINSRRFASVIACGLASEGVGVLLLDLYGSGDSEGDSRDARWDVWKLDIASALQWLRGRGRAQIGLCGLRLGAVLASEFATSSAEPIEAVFVWQPVLTGRDLLNQLLRLMIFADSTTSSPVMTPESVRGMFASGRIVQIAGHEIHPDLFFAIQRSHLLLESLPATTKITWIECAGASALNTEGSRMTAIKTYRLRCPGMTVRMVPVRRFWTFPNQGPLPGERSLLVSLFSDALSGGSKRDSDARVN